MKFLLESLADLDYQLRSVGGQLYVFQGAVTFVFRRLWEELGISSICFEQDCEPIWKDRDNAVETLCRELGIAYHEEISHTLWNPREVIETNGGIPPLTYQMFLVSETGCKSCIARSSIVFHFIPAHGSVFRATPSTSPQCRFPSCNVCQAPQLYS